MKKRKIKETKISCPFCHTFNYQKNINIKKIGKREYHCLKCQLKFFKSQITKIAPKSLNYDTGHIIFKIAVDLSDCTPQPRDFYLRPERELNFNHNRRK